MVIIIDTQFCVINLNSKEERTFLTFQSGDSNHQIFFNLHPRLKVMRSNLGEEVKISQLYWFPVVGSVLNAYVII